MLIFSILMATAAASGPESFEVPEYYKYCEQSSSGEVADQVQEQCIELAKKLVAAEKAAAKHRNEANALLVKCDALARKLKSANEFSALDAALSEAEKGTWTATSKTSKAKQPVSALACPEEIPEAASDYSNTGGVMESDAVRLARMEYAADKALYESALNAYLAAAAQAEASRTSLISAQERMVALHREGYADYIRLVDVSKVASIKRRTGQEGSQPQLTIRDCDLTLPGDETLLLANANECEHLAIAWSDPTIQYKEGPEATRPKRPTFETSLTAGQAGSNAEVLWSGRIRSFSSRFRPDSNDVVSRRPRYWSYSAGFEAKATDGIATIIGGNSDDANFLSRDRLSSTFALKGAAGLNFFRRETLEQFEEHRTKLLAELKKKCAASLNQNNTFVATNCSDAALLAWIYERDGKKFKRPDQISAYEKLIWNASQELPQFGFGGNATFGLRSQDFYRFADAEGKFDPTLVSVGPFFDEDKNYSKFGAIENRATYTLGAYGYWHFPFEDADWLDGLTVRLDGTLKYDLQDLDDRETEICRKDLSGVGTDDIFLASDQCRSVIAFEPEFKTTIIPKLTFRLGTGSIGVGPELGFAPNFSMELREGAKDLKRVDLPLFFTLKDGNLTSGIGVAREWDPAKPKNRKATTFYIFVGKRFSLDGSQQ